MAPPLFLDEAFGLISYTTIQGVFFGINLSIYFLCAQLFYRHYCKATPAERRKVASSFLYNSLMVFMASVELGTQTRGIQLTYINHGGVHGEPVEYTNEEASTVSTLDLLSIVPGFVIGFCSPIMQLWRTWIIWAISPYKVLVIIPPLLFVLTGLSLDIYAEILSSSGTLDQSQVLIGTLLSALNVAFNVSVTLLLVGRIIILRMRHLRLLGATSENATQYTSIIAMLIESYALDAVWSTGQMITFALARDGNPIAVWQVFNDAGDQVTVIAFLLVTYRVLLQRAWTPETGRQLSTLEWNRDATEGSTDITISGV